MAGNSTKSFTKISHVLKDRHVLASYYGTQKQQKFLLSSLPS